MLGQIANYCPIISRNTLVKNSTSLEFIWQTIRQHFGFQVTGAQFIDFSDIHLEGDERPEDLYQRLMAFVEDSLLRPSGLSHHGEAVTEDEELSPTLENVVVLTWLKLIHPSLPRLVKQRYGTELRSRILASIKPEISQALCSLLDEIRVSDDAKIFRTAITTEPRRPAQSSRAQSSKLRAPPRKPRQDKVCPLCKQAGRQDTRHFLSECAYLPDSDRRYIVKARQIVSVVEDESDTDDDSGVVGETRISFTRGDRVFQFDGFVVVDLDVDILAGTPFMEANDVAVHPAKREVILGDGTIYKYGSSVPAESSTAARRAFVLRAPTQSETIWPGEFIEMQLPGDVQSDAEYAIEPRSDTLSARRLKSSQMEYDVVFDPDINGYNDAAGPFKARVNMGPVESPQRKGCLPLYARGKLVELQAKFDQLEELGVFRHPEDVDVAVEYLNPSFLVKKPNGGSRMVTAFADVGRYSKPKPSLLPNVDSTLRLIACWKHIVVTDLTSAFYQIPLARESMKYCGVATPFKGVRVYTWSAMGMPGSETALEELMCRVLGPLLQEGIVAKIADDLYCGGDTPQELFHNWKRILQALYKCDLRLSASKMVITPKSTTILGWIWCAGTLTASPHRVNTLAACPAPDTVGRMRSFVGAYKVLSRVVPRCSAYLAPLDVVTAGRQSSEAIVWTDELRDSFHSAQKALLSVSVIALPKPSDQLWIVTDGAVRQPGIGATLYVSREGRLHLAGFFSAKLRGSQTTWLPCEVEALSIAAATKHFSPYIVQSGVNACVLTDSKPCVQAYEKLCRGEFSASPRVSTFLSVVSRYQASVRHVAGSAILPSDFASRNVPLCEDEGCQVCSFIERTADSVVRMTSVQDVLDGSVRLPFTSRSAWLTTQSECPGLCRTHAHLIQGTRLSRKITNVRDVKRYLNVATVAAEVLDGLLTALHIQLAPPTCHQLKAVVKRYLYALDLDKAVERVSDGCHSCAALRRSPGAKVEQSTSPPPDAVGVSFAADVLKRSRQVILVLRETVTSFTSTLLISDECHETLRDALVQLCIQMRPMDGPLAVVRTDPAPGFKALVGDGFLHQHRVMLELGHAKNPNKNPVAEKAIQELTSELLRLDPLGSAVTPLTLAVATAALNSRIRSRGLSSREMWTQRDQFSNVQVPLGDGDLVATQHRQRLANHPHSERSKAPRAQRRPDPALGVGDLVYLHSDRNKSRARDRYLVVSVDPLFCNIRKLVGSQLRTASYRVRLSDCFKVPSDVSDEQCSPGPCLSDCSEDEDLLPEDGDLPPSSHPPPLPPAIPAAISAPVVVDVHLGAASCPPVCSVVPSEAGQVSGCVDVGRHTSPDLPEIAPSACQGPRQPSRHRRPPTYLRDFTRM
ncbi:hypothetical protein SKAU_G00096850 [Synaphobranchus kaupii]|uniref:ribonuclease H n=1 Tax=Synaphobranchus kaupii TaxID=118154 RepID=A0A9Q1FY04_SYNKA|nr:hypothetical protein SKAU_G00096850 [Synaphobranchus kaupii]